MERTDLGREELFGGLISRETHPFSRYPTRLYLHQLKFHPQPPDIKPRSRPDGFDIATYNFLFSEDHDGFPNTLTSRASNGVLAFSAFAYGVVFENLEGRVAWVSCRFC